VIPEKDFVTCLILRVGRSSVNQDSCLFYKRKGREGAIIIDGPSWCGWGGEASAKTGEGLFVTNNTQEKVTRFL
jgi:hypothetical protein